ncbi:hypothetical protein MTR_2g059630 [Medicago truncatula]|uniref:Transmembrane protein n=1 Tax=Medicago truncatula TaxID=3880 RepID=G7IGP3_MEDTR|nr:hypothetical protein MTR_2g059630 [Medicago truncatula]
MGFGKLGIGWFVLVGDAAAPAATAERSGKIRTTAPGRVGTCQKWKAAKADYKYYNNNLY